ncbi:CRISPR-associated endonuclease Cas2, partial [Roseiarcaceae bacterium H3SJ34-1]|uniref:CRISPR-associated endonuclease Cas2 n=1 Tax=Terripilifer ovatus TaxID=3032367 RepID=UPI003AB951AA|nr:CRISPR-associated endonuclease Cas2 [Roseiarcaceae bacterium H3SJ34-1]
PPPYPPPTICKHVDQQTAIPTPNLCKWDANAAYVATKKQRAEATKFRQFLLDQGFEMSQFSNYLRLVNGQEQFDAYTRRVGSHLPERGDIFIFQFTDRQYENIIRFSDQGRRARQKNPEQIMLF